MQFDYHSKMPSLGRGRQKVTLPHISLPWQSVLQANSPLLRIVQICSFILGAGFILIALFMSVLRVQSTWNEANPTGIVIFTQDANVPVRKHVSLYWINPNNEVVSVVHLPDMLKVSSTTFGTYAVSSLYDLFTLEEQRQKELLRILSLYFHIPLTGYIVVSTGFDVQKASLTEIARHIFVSNDSSFSLADRYAFLTFFLTTNFRVDTENIDRVVSATSKDGLIEIDQEKYQQFVARSFADSRIVAENVTVAIVNASSHSGLATKTAATLTSFGLHPVAVTDTMQTREHSELLFRSDKIKRSLTGNLASFLFATEGKVDEKIADQYRSDIVVFVGTEFGNLLTP